MLAKSEDDRSHLQNQVAALNAQAQVGAVAAAAAAVGGAVTEGDVEALRMEAERLKEENGRILEEKNVLLGGKVGLERQVFEADKLTWQAQHALSELKSQMQVCVCVCV